MSAVGPGWADLAATWSPWPDHHGFAASVTFDGGYDTTLDAALPVLRAHGVPSTWFLVAGSVGGLLEGRRVAGWERWVEAVGAGDVEVGNHSLTHPVVRRSPTQFARWALSPHRTAARVVRLARRQPRTAPTEPPPPLDPSGRRVAARAMYDDARQGRTVLEWQLQRPVTVFAPPSGRSHPRVARTLERDGTIAQRTTEAGCLVPPGDLRAVPAELYTVATTDADAASWVARAQQSGGWYVDVHHLVTDDTSYHWSTPVAGFDSQVRRLRASGAWVQTFGTVARQLAASAGTAVSVRTERDGARITKTGPVPVTVRITGVDAGRELALPDGGPVKRLDGAISWAAPAGAASLEL